LHFALRRSHDTGARRIPRNCTHRLRRTPPSEHRAVLKKILLAAIASVVLIVVVLLIVVALQPADYRVERSATMAAPPEAVFAQVNDFHRWEAWSPWAKLDPQMQQTFEGPAEGTGAIYSWSGNDEVGQGRMTILESRPDELVRIKLEFLAPFEATSTAEFTFRPEGDETAVTWSMTGENGFLAKAIHLFLDMDALVGRDFEKGLAQMKAAVESAPQYEP
jgi:uncharacterized protein YndB with AHSA1/START domain